MRYARRSFFSQLVYPDVCAICGSLVQKAGASPQVCLACEQKLPFRLGKEAKVVLQPLMFLTQPQLADVPIYVAFDYVGAIPHAVAQLKFASRTDVAAAMAPYLALLYKRHRLLVDAIIPMPLSRERAKERGYNQAELLADGLGELLQLPVVTDILYRSKNTLRQSDKKSVAGRINEMQHAFTANFAHAKFLRHGRVLLVDDVITTGATFLAAAAALQAIDIEVTGLCLSHGFSRQKQRTSETARDTRYNRYKAKIKEFRRKTNA